LACLGKALGRKTLQEVASIASPETILRWYREHVAKKDDGRKRRRPGRPRKRAQIARLLLKMAGENPRWGYTRLRGAARASRGIAASEPWAAVATFGVSVVMAEGRTGRPKRYCHLDPALHHGAAAPVAHRAGSSAILASSATPMTDPAIAGSIFVAPFAAHASGVELRVLVATKRIVHLLPIGGSLSGLDEISVVSPPGTSVAELDLPGIIRTAIAVFKAILAAGGDQKCTTTKIETTLEDGTTVSISVTTCEPA
jgi:hypothetical protein